MPSILHTCNFLNQAPGHPETDDVPDHDLRDSTPETDSEQRSPDLKLSQKKSRDQAPGATDNVPHSPPHFPSCAFQLHKNNSSCE